MHRLKLVESQTFQIGEIMSQVEISNPPSSYLGGSGTSLKGVTFSWTEHARKNTRANQAAGVKSVVRDVATAGG